MAEHLNLGLHELNINQHVITTYLFFYNTISSYQELVSIRRQNRFNKKGVANMKPIVFSPNTWLMAGKIFQRNSHYTFFRRTIRPENNADFTFKKTLC